MGVGSGLQGSAGFSAESSFRFKVLRRRLSSLIRVVRFFGNGSRIVEYLQVERR
jgi:hypothetical protein